MLSLALRNAMLDLIDNATWLSLHTAYSTVGANEVAGGSYIRKQAVFSAAINGLKNLFLLPVIFDVPAGTISWIGLWDAVSSGTFYGMVPIDLVGSTYPKPFTMSNTSTDTLVSIAHELALNTSIVVWTGAQALPSGLTEGAIIYAQPGTGDSFTVTDVLGAAINLTTVGQGYWQRITPQVFGTSGTFTLNGLSFRLPGV